MDCKPNLFDFEDLAFFGRINASISHELKNIMAIISETAGLLSDLSAMARKGGSIELDMLTESTESIIEEIQRGFKTIRQLNRFSHSVDTPIVSIDLTEVLDLVSHLSGYLSFAGKLNIHPVDGEPPMVLTCPFILQTIIYEAVVRMFQDGGPGVKLDVFIRSGDDSTRQIFFEGFCITKSNGFPSDKMECMASSIGASIHYNPSEARLEIAVPISAQDLAVSSGLSGIPTEKNRE
jgi:hypothetical protein